MFNTQSTITVISGERVSKLVFYAQSTGAVISGRSLARVEEEEEEEERKKEEKERKNVKKNNNEYLKQGERKISRERERENFITQG